MPAMTMMVAQRIQMERIQTKTMIAVVVMTKRIAVGRITAIRNTVAGSGSNIRDGVFLAGVQHCQGNTDGEKQSIFH